jgi:hypothetical protein
MTQDPEWCVAKGRCSGDGDLPRLRRGSDVHSGVFKGESGDSVGMD